MRIRLLFLSLLISTLIGGFVLPVVVAVVVAVAVAVAVAVTPNCIAAQDGGGAAIKNRYSLVFPLLHTQHSTIFCFSTLLFVAGCSDQKRNSIFC